ncbi:hypothetical protein QWY31_10705 [Cytophagales bacterium LB-30]|uniref:GyrI-like small molecule binding domain-containing protein n=1 Tax=Shiella aurantiaca TaxID=3058365 RepID=A0ABT8F6V7_9BACT|nr:GyrI-like domain-containing protein [Shiella aurantiaca]MDN4165974.1 hypothetical protein [Shiella aurantiaca]
MKKFLVIALLIFGVGLAIFYALGGFNPIQISETQAPAPFLVGQRFEGRYTDQRLSEHFFAAKAWKDKEAVNGTLAVVFYNDPEKAKGQSYNFTGLATADTSKIPSGYEVIPYPAQRLLQARIEANSLVFPRPKTVQKELQAYAAEHGLRLDTLSIELYRSDRELLVQVPIKE